MAVETLDMQAVSRKLAETSRNPQLFSQGDGVVKDRLHRLLPLLGQLAKRFVRLGGDADVAVARSRPHCPDDTSCEACRLQIGLQISVLDRNTHTG